MTHDLIYQKHAENLVCWCHFKTAHNFWSLRGQTASSHFPLYVKISIISIPSTSQQLCDDKMRHTAWQEYLEGKAFSRHTCSCKVKVIAELVKNLPAVQETWVWSLSWEDPLEEGKPTHSSILTWRIPWTVWSMGSQRVGHNWATFTFTYPSSSP